MKILAARKNVSIVESLLVVIIVVISSAVFFTMNNINEVLAAARDARRISEILTLQTAISGSLATGDIKLKNCVGCTSLNEDISINGNGWVKFTNVSGKGLQTFLKVLPLDPINKEDLFYFYNSEGTSFEILTKLESKKYASYATEDGGKYPELYERGVK